MFVPPKKRPLVPAAGAFLLAIAASSNALAIECAALEGDAQVLYGAGGSAVTATMANIATALVALPADERVKIFYNDPGACTGYQSLITPGSGQLEFKTWNAAGEQSVCTAPATKVVFAHMGNTPLLCPGNQPLPAGFAKYVGPVQTINFITSFDSTQRAITAEALYHIFGLGPGASGRSVAPWTVPASVYGRTVSSFVHQIIAAAVGVPPSAFKLPLANFLRDNPTTIEKVAAVANPEEALGYVSGSAADEGQDSQDTRTLAYRHFDQTCAYLPDSSETRKDKLNVRTGQYYLATPGWLYAKVNTAGKPVAQDGTTEVPLVSKFIGWFDGSLPAPDGLELVKGSKTLTSVTEIIIDSGDIPLCAMQAIRPEGDLSPLQSYAPDKPCNGFFEQIATGSTEYKACTGNAACTGENEICSFGFCEVTYPDNAN